MDIWPRFSVIVLVLQWTDPALEDPYQILKGLIVSEVILNQSRPEGLIRNSWR
jgi:hypothetical protein